MGFVVSDLINSAQVPKKKEEKKQRPKEEKGRG